LIRLYQEQWRVSGPVKLRQPTKDVESTTPEVSGANACFLIERKSDKVRLSMFVDVTRMQPRFIQAGFLFACFSWYLRYWSCLK